MTAKELKKRLMHKIDQSDNNELLEEMYRLIANEEADIGVYELSEEQIKAVEEGQLQYKNGEFLTEDQADKDIDEWLGK
jgi:predicted transcriptional regulator